MNNNLFFQQQLFMKQLIERYSLMKNSYDIQRDILNLMNNNNNPIVSGGNKFNNIFTTSSNDNNDNGQNSDIINIIFRMSQGNQHTRSYNQNETIRNMLKQFVNSFGLSENTLKEIIFLHNAVNLNNIDQNLTLKEQRIHNNARINVMDLNDIIGAWNN